METQSKARRMGAWTWLAAIAFCLALYGQTLKWPPTDWDDPEHIFNNPAMQAPTVQSVLGFWEKPFWGLYIPLTYSVWSGVAAIAATPPTNAGQPPTLSTVPFRIANLAAHVIAAVGVANLAALWCAAPLPSLFAALIFVVHPLQVEPVAWISGFRDVLSGSLAIWSLWFALTCLPSKIVASSSRRGRRWRYGLSLLLFASAMLAKPSAIVVIPIGVTLAVLSWQIPWRRALLAAAPFMFFAFIPIWLTLGIQGVGAAPAPWLHRPIIAADALFFHLSRTIFPTSLAPVYDRSPAEVLAGNNIATMIGIVICTGWIVTLLARRRYGLAALPLCWMLAHLPNLGFIPFTHQIHSTVADRYNFLPLAVISVAGCLGLRELKTQRLQAALAPIVVTILLLLSLAQVQIWRSAESLWRHSLKITPTSIHAINNLAILRHQSGAKDEALELWLSAIKLKPDSVYMPYINAGTILAGRGQWAEAEALQRKGIALAPTYKFGRVALVHTLVAAGKISDAKEEIKSLKEMFPEDGEMRELQEAVGIGKSDPYDPR